MKGRCAMGNILERYQKMKSDNPDVVILARRGDDCEIFGSDAVALAPLLGAKVTTSGFVPACPPMISFPYDSCEKQITAMTNAGYKVALVESLNDRLTDQQWDDLSERIDSGQGISLAEAMQAIRYFKDRGISRYFGYSREGWLEAVIEVLEAAGIDV